jgi:hypothetical protein
MWIRKIARNSFVEPFARRIYLGVAARRFRGSQDYWQKRYSSGRTSGEGSGGRLARFKADVLNQFVRREGISSVVEFGCGDGSQLSLGRYPAYLGFDVSPAAIDLCRRRFAGDKTKSFAVLGTVDPSIHDAALSLDVIYHLIEDEAFEAHMAAIFNSARRFVVIYSSNCTDPPPAPHVRHRRFTDWIERHRPDWKLSHVVRNEYPYDRRNDNETSFADFYFFENAMNR